MMIGSPEVERPSDSCRSSEPIVRRSRGMIVSPSTARFVDESVGLEVTTLNKDIARTRELIDSSSRMSSSFRDISRTRRGCCRLLDAPRDQAVSMGRRVTWTSFFIGTRDRTSLYQQLCVDVVVEKVVENRRIEAQERQLTDDVVDEFLELRESQMSESKEPYGVNYSACLGVGYRMFLPRRWKGGQKDTGERLPIFHAGNSDDAQG